MNSSRSKYISEIQLLLTLEAAGQCGWSTLGRLQVQKLSYLGRVLAPLKGILERGETFQYDMNGPYSSAVQNLLDHLVAVGLVNMSDYAIIAHRDQERAKYGISADGTELVMALVERHTKHSVEFEWLKRVYRVVAFYGLDRILALVYQEPTCKPCGLRGLAD